MSTMFKSESVQWAKENVQIDGEADYTISAVFYESPDHQEERARLQAQYDAIEDDESEEAEELSREIEGYDDNPNGAWLIVEVFPEDDPRDGRPMFDSLEEAFGDECVLVDPEAD